MRGIIKGYPELPTLPASSDIFQLINEMPIKEVMKDLGETAKGISGLVNSSDLKRSLSELPNTIEETKQTMRSLRFLAEYLEQLPESILKGKPVGKGE